MYDVQGFVSCAAFCNDSRLLLAVSRGKRNMVCHVFSGLSLQAELGEKCKRRIFSYG